MPPRSHAVARLGLLVLAGLLGCAPQQSTAPRRSVTGTVSRPGGGRAVNAMVALVAPLTSTQDVAGLTLTNAGGQFGLEGIAPGDYELTASLSDSFAAATRVLVIRDYDSFVPVTLQKACGLRGRVTRSGATRHDGTRVLVDGTLLGAQTDSTGNWAIGGVPSGAWTVWAVHPGFRLDSVTAVVPAPGDTATIAPRVLTPLPP